jgi:hypothetical protein
MLINNATDSEIFELGANIYKLLQPAILIRFRISHLVGARFLKSVFINALLKNSLSLARGYLVRLYR